MIRFKIYTYEFKPIGSGDGSLIPLYALNSFDILYEYGEYEKAYWELQKVVDLIISTYQVDHYSEMIDIVKQKNFTQEGCKFAANAIYEIYTDVVNRPRRQYQTDNRTNSVQLV